MEIPDERQPSEDKYLLKIDDLPAKDRLESRVEKGMPYLIEGKRVRMKIMPLALSGGYALSAVKLRDENSGKEIHQLTVYLSGEETDQVKISLSPVKTDSVRMHPGLKFVYGSAFLFLILSIIFSFRLNKFS
jgi:hypothetical protein